MMESSITHVGDGALSEHDLLFNAYVDDELAPAERVSFEERLVDDPAFREAFDSFQEMMSGLHELPFVFAPDDFVVKVQSRVRARSRGRFFAESIFDKYRVPYEVIAIVMILVMASAYIMMEAPRDRNLHGDVTVDTITTRP